MSLTRNTLVQASLTLTSRVFGFMRDVLLASRVGAGPIGDAWATALMFPNLFRRIFAEGAFAQAFVPSYSRTLEENGPDAARLVAQDALRVLFAATALLALMAQLAMPWLLLVIHGGQADDKENFALAILLTQITMPYLTCMSLAALLSGVLNSLGRFILSAGAPILLNICLIGSLLVTSTAQLPASLDPADLWMWVRSTFLEGHPVSTAIGAAWAVLVAGVLQALLLYWGVRRQRVPLSLIGLPRLTPRVKHILLLAVPGTIAASGTQINILVSQFLASYEVGAKTWLYYADRLYQLPLGLVGVAVGLAILPQLSRAARRDNDGDGQRMMDEGIGLAMVLTLPAAAALFLAPAFFIEGIFTRGAFLTSDAEQAGRALVHYAWGIPAFVLIKVLAPGFFAREDTKTPMRFALVSVAINTVLGAGLFLWLSGQGNFGYPGLAIATSVAAWANALLLGFGLARRGWYRPGPVLVGRLIRVSFATAAMTGALWLAIQHENLVQQALWVDSKLLVALLIILASMIVYTLAALIFGAVRPRELLGALKRS